MYESVKSVSNPAKTQTYWLLSRQVVSQIQFPEITPLIVSWSITGVPEVPVTLNQTLSFSLKMAMLK